MPSKRRFKSTLFRFLVSVLLAANVNLHLLYAASCCVGNGGQIFLVLPSEQKYQLGLSASYRTIDGYFDPYGSYQKISERDSSEVFSTSFGAAYRLSENWQAGFALPIVHNRNEFSQTMHTATEVGDPTIEGRFTLWDDLRFLPWRPQASIYAGVRIPVAKSIEDSSDPYHTDAVGDGVFKAHFGVNISKIYHPIRLTMDASFVYPFAKDVDEVGGRTLATSYSLKPGNQFQLGEALSYLVSEKWSAHLGFKQVWGLESEKDGQGVAGSAQRLFSSSLGLNYFYNIYWSVGLSYETVFPFYSYAANQANTQTASLTMTYGGF